MRMRAVFALSALLLAGCTVVSIRSPEYSDLAGGAGSSVRILSDLPAACVRPEEVR